jgi:hypothetical protein
MHALFVLVTYLFNYLFTYLLIYLLTYLFTYVLTYLLIFLLFYLLTYLFITYLFTYLLTHLLTHSMQHSLSWEANRFSASQEIPRIYGTRMFITAFTSARHLSPILSQLNPVHTPHIPLPEDSS